MDEEVGLQRIQENSASPYATIIGNESDGVFINKGEANSETDALSQTSERLESSSPFQDECKEIEDSPRQRDTEHLATIRNRSLTLMTPDLNKTQSSASAQSSDEPEPTHVMSSASAQSSDEPEPTHVMPSASAQSSDEPEPTHVMSEASKRFDRHGKGYLDSTERALRRLDSDNDGKLTIHNVYDLMRSLQESQKLSNELMTTLRREQKKSMNLKKGVIALIAFSFLLSLANIGTSFAAARLAKDTEISSSGDLVVKDSQERVGTTSKVVAVTMKPPTESAQRRLQTIDGFDVCIDLTTGNSTTPLMAAESNSPSVNCTLQGTMDYGVAVDMYRYFCHSWVPSVGGRCPTPNAGVDKLLVSCNGYNSVIFGGDHFPGQGPAVKFGHIYFPTSRLR